MVESQVLNILCILVFFLLTVNCQSPSPCVVNVTSPPLTPHHYNGSWFVIARKAAQGKDYLPEGFNTSLIRLIVDSEGNLNMTEYHSINGTCMPPLSGIWKKQVNGYLMEVRTATGHLFQIAIRAIFHEYSGENNEEMNMVLYGCREVDSYGNCLPEEELVSILSNSRHPQTLQLFKSAKHIEDYACVDILRLKTLNTYSHCGDEIVDEDQKLRHAIIYENDQYVDVECRVENFGDNAVDITRFFDEPRMLTVIAYIDPDLEDEQISHISCLYDSKTHAKCEWLRQKSCFNTELTQEFTSPTELNIRTKFTKVNGSEVDIDWSGMVIWQNGDEYISLKCLLIGEDGSCDQYRVYVWSDEDLMDQPTIREIYNALQEVCVDPTDLIFLNTFHECSDPDDDPESSVPCGPLSPWDNVNLSLIQGVWYVAADLNADPKIFLQSTVIEFTPNSTESNLLDLRFFAQKEFDKECVGPGNGQAILMDNSTLDVTIEYGYRLVPSYRNKMKFKLQILYLDNQRAVLYWCFRRNQNGSCIQYDVDILIRSRFFSHNDLSLVQPYLHRACVKEENLRWFDLHSNCGYEMSASTKLRRDMVTLSHSEVLDILTNVQEPKCEVRKINGVRANLTALQAGGTWFLVAQYDEMALDTYALVARLHAIGNSSAVLRMYQSAAPPGEPRMCFERVASIKERVNGTDYSYELHFDSSRRNSTTLIFRFLFFNRHVGVLYSCLNYKEDGRCEENALYVISRHESIDHAELTVLETVAKTVCFDPTVLFHTATHDICVYDHQRLLRPRQCATVEVPQGFTEMKRSQIERFYSGVKLYAVASSKLYVEPFTIKWNGSNFIATKSRDGSCLSSSVTVSFSSLHRYLFLIDDAVVLVNANANLDEIQMKKAQISANIPCLYPINYGESPACENVRPPICQSSSALSAAEDLLGDWLLFASDPYIVGNCKCTVAESDSTENTHQFTCYSESWQGECEREERLQFSVDAWGGYELKSEVGTVHENFELFPKGNVSLTKERLLFWWDEPLIGRRWSVWVHPGWPVLQTTEDGQTPQSPVPTSSVPSDLSPYCIWPTGPQQRTMEQNC